MAAPGTPRGPPPPAESFPVPPGEPVIPVALEDLVAALRWLKTLAPPSLLPPERLDTSDIAVALVPLLEPEAPDITVPASPTDFPALLRKLAVMLTYCTKATYDGSKHGPVEGW